VSLKIFYSEGRNRRPLMACHRPLRYVENRVGALRYEKLLLECQTKSSVEAGVPLETFLGNVAEAYRPEAGDELVLAQTGAIHDHRSRADEDVSLLLPLPKRALTEDFDQKVAAACVVGGLLCPNEMSKPWRNVRH